MGQRTHQASVWCSKHYFFFITSYRLRALKTLYFNFCKIIESMTKNWKGFCKEFWKKSWNKIILRTSDTWSMSHSYYVEDCLISSYYAQGQMPFPQFFSFSHSHSLSLFLSTYIYIVLLWRVKKYTFFKKILETT